MPPTEVFRLPDGNDRPVFVLLRAADGPFSARRILKRLKPDRPRIAAPTVFRAPQDRNRAGRMRRIESLNACLPAYGTGDRAGVFSIGDECGRVQERDGRGDVGRITGALAKARFRPTHRAVEVQGRCGGCDDTQRPGRTA